MLIGLIVTFTCGAVIGYTFAEIYNDSSESF